MIFNESHDINTWRSNQIPNNSSDSKSNTNSLNKSKLHGSILEIPDLLSQISTLYAQRLQWTEQYFDRIEKLKKIDKYIFLQTKNETPNSNSKTNIENIYNQSQNQFQMRKHYTKIFYIPLLSPSPSKSPMEIALASWRWGIEYFGSEAKWKLLLNAWTRDAVPLKQWPFHVDPLIEKRFEREVQFQRELHCLDVKCGIACIQLLILICEIEAMFQMIKKPISHQLFEFLNQNRPSMIQMTRGIATGTFLALWIEINAWWKEFEIFYLNTYNKKVVNNMDVDVQTFQSNIQYFIQNYIQNNYSKKITSIDLNNTSKEHALNNDFELKSVQEKTLYSKILNKSKSKSIKSIVNRLQYHLSSNNIFDWKKLPLANMSIGDFDVEKLFQYEDHSTTALFDKISHQDSKLRKNQQQINFFKLLKNIYKESNNNFTNYKQILFQKMGIVEDFIRISTRLDQIAYLLPEYYFQELMDLDVLWIKSVSSEQKLLNKSQFNEKNQLISQSSSQTSNIIFFNSLKGMNTNQNIHPMNSTKSIRTIDKLFQFISQSRTKQCLDRLAYNTAFHDACEAFNKSIQFINIRTESAIPTSQNYATLLKQYCLFQMNHTKDPKKIEWFAECQNLISLIESHFQNPIPDRETFIAFTRKYAQQVARFDAFLGNPVISYLKKNYAIRMTIAYMSKAYSIQEMMQYSELYIYYRRMKKLTFSSYIEYLQNFRSLYKKNHYHHQTRVHTSQLKINKVNSVNTENPIQTQIQTTDLTHLNLNDKSRWSQESIASIKFSNPLDLNPTPKVNTKANPKSITTIYVPSIFKG